MTLKFTFFAIILFGYAHRLAAQTEGDYRSIASGSWSSTTTWERYTSGAWAAATSAPVSTDEAIEIQSGNTVTISASLTVDQVTVDAGATLNIDAALTLPGTLTNNGTLGWTSGAISMTSGTINNSGTFTITGNNSISNTSGTNAVNNLAGGTITKSTGTSTTDFQVPFNNAGTINVNSGIFAGTQSTSTWTNSGTINLTNSSTFSQVFNGTLTFNSGSAITGTGLVRLEATAINAALTIPSGIQLQVNGNLTGTGGSLTVDGIMNWVANTISIPVTVSTTGTLNLTGTGNKNIRATFVLNGSTDVGGSGQLVFNASTLTNNGTFVISTTGTTADIHSFATPNSFVNNGTFVANAASAFTLTSVPLTNNAAGIIKGIGTLNFAGSTGGLTNSGTIAPGDDIGVLTINQSSIGTSNVEIEILDGSGAGTGNDQLAISATGTTDLSTITLNIIDNSSATSGTTYTILTTAGTFSNTFAAVNSGGLYSAPVVTTNTVTIQKIATLPVTWGEFFLKSADQKVVLTWSTLQESNTSHFDVEHSSDGQSYNVIGTVTAKGNSSLTSTYTFTDASPVARSKNFYRLRQVDLDGKYVYSGVRYLSLVNGAGTVFNIYPNPVESVMHVNVASNTIDLVISDISGRRLKTARLQAGLHYIAVSDLVAGVYQVTAYQNGQILASQLISKN